MKKMIIVEEESTKNNLVKNKFVNFIISLVCYALVLILVSMLFKDFYINNKYYGLYAVIAALIIDILNKTIKPVLVVMTMPLTAITLGLSYPIVNMIILFLTSFIMGNNFNITGFFTAFFASILISIFNMFMDGFIIKPITKDSK
ncbi:MAG: phage holin family protein [Bacilli bacterium]|nr:phage holin family protein [Bacilli bacterium]